MKKLLTEENEGIYLDGMTTPVFCKKTGSFYPHDFDETGIDAQIESVQAKYQRRILRMFQLFDDPKNRFVFIGHDYPLNPFQAEQYAISGVEFDNRLGYLTWQPKFKKIMNTVYPNVRYECYTLEEIKRLYPWTKFGSLVCPEQVQWH